MTTTEDFTVRLYDALVATLVREGNAIDDTKGNAVPRSKR